MILIAASFSKEYLENNCKLYTPEITILMIFTFIELLAWLHISNCVIYKVVYLATWCLPPSTQNTFIHVFLLWSLRTLKQYLQWLPSFESHAWRKKIW